jgi:hypothetical protein
MGLTLTKYYYDNNEYILPYYCPQSIPESNNSSLKKIKTIHLENVIKNKVYINK